MSKLYFRHSAMGGGKTTSLLQVRYNYERRGMTVLLIKPAIDTKGANTVVSRIGISAPVDILLDKSDTIMERMEPKKPDAIIVDEAQFLTAKQVDELYTMSKLYDIPVLCYGLRTDFKTNGFEGSTRLLEIADDIEELKTICACGKKATFNMRKINGESVFEGEQIIIDDSDTVEYEAICGECLVRQKGRLR